MVNGAAGCWDLVGSNSEPKLSAVVVFLPYSDGRNQEGLEPLNTSVLVRVSMKKRKLQKARCCCSESRLDCFAGGVSLIECTSLCPAAEIPMFF